MISYLTKKWVICFYVIKAPTSQYLFRKSEGHHIFSWMKSQPEITPKCFKECRCVFICLCSTSHQSGCWSLSTNHGAVCCYLRRCHYPLLTGDSKLCCHVTCAYEWQSLFSVINRRSTHYVDEWLGFYAVPIFIRYFVVLISDLALSFHSSKFMNGGYESLIKQYFIDSCMQTP